MGSYVHRAHLDYAAERDGIAVTRASARRLFELFPYYPTVLRGQVKGITSDTTQTNIWDLST